MAGPAVLDYDDRLPRMRMPSKAITTPVAYINAIVLANLEGVFVDIDAQTSSLLPGKLEETLESTNNLGKYPLI